MGMSAAWFVLATVNADAAVTGRRPSVLLWRYEVGRAKPFQIDFAVPTNGRLHKASVQVLDGEGRVLFSDKADMMDAKEREKLANRVAVKLKVKPAEVMEKVEGGMEPCSHPEGPG